MRWQSAQRSTLTSRHHLRTRGDPGKWHVVLGFKSASTVSSNSKTVSGSFDPRRVTGASYPGALRTPLPRGGPSTRRAILLSVLSLFHPRTNGHSFAPPTRSSEIASLPDQTCGLLQKIHLSTTSGLCMFLLRDLGWPYLVGRGSAQLCPSLLADALKHQIFEKRGTRAGSARLRRRLSSVFAEALTTAWAVNLPFPALRWLR